MYIHTELLGSITVVGIDLLTLDHDVLVSLVADVNTRTRNRGLYGELGPVRKPSRRHIDESRVCVRFENIYLENGQLYGAVAPAGPYGSAFMTMSKDSYEFRPRVCGFARPGGGTVQRIVTWDVVLKS